MRRPPLACDERGDGLIDVMVGVLIFGILAAVILATLATLDRVTADVSGAAQAAALASRVVSDAQAGGCGEVTGASSSTEAQSVLSRCTWGSNQVAALADVVATDGSTTPRLCTHSNYNTAAPANSVGTGACYRAANFTFTASLHFTWGWAVAPPGQSPSTWNACNVTSDTSMGGASGVPQPDELIRSAKVRWPDKLVSATATYQRTVTETGAAPAALTSESASGNLGGLVVDVNSTTPQDVGLVVPGLSATIVEQTAPGSSGSGDCVVFPFLPASSSGYQVWVGDTANLFTSPAVSSDTWTALTGSPA